ncbi:hypothetical protein H310_05916 [Aphanomyces invadans]|uniref:Uncharacterized protein n=1 Tax=Aphanomyces invadans TaxID=157072 RepID=A0A024U896_9STRA|nr:hypothetical protein H310_05916 [Aphanomyces invadans]ETW02400.1 hypothetical protein H310_05916 [Aphanomyces invadans]|eukprot:XP_008869005.1 hypothetical protein H310_05916 [Aphanomyces invadans]
MGVGRNGDLKRRLRVEVVLRIVVCVRRRVWELRGVVRMAMMMRSVLHKVRVAPLERHGGRPKRRRLGRWDCLGVVPQHGNDVFIDRSRRQLLKRGRRTAVAAATARCAWTRMMCTMLLVSRSPRRGRWRRGHVFIVRVAMGLEMATQVARRAEALVASVDFASKRANAGMRLGVASQLFFRTKPLVAHLERTAKGFFTRVGKFVATQVA